MESLEPNEWECAAREARALGVEAPGAWAAAVRARLPSAPQAFEPRRVAELLLAEACAAGDPAALTSFDARFLAPVVEQVARRHPAVDGSDLAQLVRVRLLVGEGPRRLRAWRGQGSLAGWLRSVATRVALNASPTKPAEPLDDAKWDGVVRRLSTTDPERSLIERSRTLELQRALREALRRLPQREKVVLRLHVFEDMSTEQLGRMFKVNPATARRWLQGARETVLDAVRTTLQGTARWSNSQVESALNGLGSTPDLGLSGLGPSET